MGLRRRWPSLYKYCPARDRSRLVVSGIATNDRRAMAERIRCRRFCGPSTSSRISGLGFRAQGCLERRFLHAYSGLLRTLCQILVGRALLGGGQRVCPGSHVQANAGNGAACSIATRLLAAQTFCWRIVNKATDS